MGSSKADVLALFKRLVELVKPNLRHYYRMPIKAKVTATYESDGRYWCDVQPLRNDETVDDKHPVIPKVEVPILWGGPKRGVVCPPLVGTHVAVAWYDGDPDYPYIEHVRWHANQAPDVEVGGLIIQRTPGTHIKIDAQNNIIHVTPANRRNEIGGDKTQEIGGDLKNTVVGNKNEEVGKAWKIVCAESATIQAPVIYQRGNVSSKGVGGGHGQETKDCDTDQTGDFTLIGNLQVNGNITCTGTVTADVLDGSWSEGT